MKHPIAKMHTTKGVITIEMYPEHAPNAVASFIWAAQQGLFRNRLIKRVVPGFVIQPSYTYYEDERCKYNIRGEFSANGFENNLKMEKWTVALAGDGAKIASGCEFFITLSDETGEKLQGRFSAFGKVIDGFEEVDRLENVPVYDVHAEGVSAVLKQPVEDEYMLDVQVETFGVEYPRPVIDHWIE